MFHWAPPEVNGLGVITSTPSPRRSSQVWMFSGFPGLTAKTTTEFGDHARVLVLVPVRVDEAGVDEAGNVGLEREGDDVGRQALLDGAPLLAGGCVGLLEVEALTFWRLLEGRDNLLVGLARSRVGDEGEGAAVPAGGTRRVVAAAAAGGDERGQD